MVKEILIRECRKSDWRGIMEVCYRTGYMGEDVESHFGDKYLFGLMFCLYYPWYEWWNGFVAESNGKIVGYILGSNDTKRQSKNFNKKMIWRILFRLIFISWWRYNGVLRTLVHLVSMIPKVMNGSVEWEAPWLGETEIEYPAHLHIDILESYQRRGIGSELMKKFEDKLKSIGVKGIHLETSTGNKKAIPFYKKQGFKIAKITGTSLWWDAINEKGLLFVKKLDKKNKKIN
ncbi:MAG: GNAT family N-acetyltransferase [Candidatus Helarchaeota archaeon]